MNKENNDNDLKGGRYYVQVQQNSHHSTQQINISSRLDFNQATHVFEQLEENIDSLNLPPDDVSNLRGIIKEVAPKLQSKTDETFITQSLSTVKGILVNAGGSLVAKGVLYLISELGG